MDTARTDAGRHAEALMVTTWQGLVGKAVARVTESGGDVCLLFTDGTWAYVEYAGDEGGLAEGLTALFFWGDQQHSWPTCFADMGFMTSEELRLEAEKRREEEELASRQRQAERRREQDRDTLYAEWARVTATLVHGKCTYEEAASRIEEICRKIEEINEEALNAE